MVETRNSGSVNIITIGNPGSGKSTLQNGMIGHVAFKAGVNMGGGLTTRLCVYTKDGIKHIDTPGLNDCESKQSAAEEIRRGLQIDGYYRIFFVVTLESGRIKPEDISTMKLVLEAAKQIKTSYSIVINKVAKSICEKMKNNQTEFKKLKTKLVAGLPAPTDRVFLNEKEDRIDDVDDQLPTLTDEFRRFVRESPLIEVSKGEVSYIEWDKFEKTQQALADSLKRLDEDKKLLEELEAKHKAEIQAEKDRQKAEKDDRDRKIAALETDKARLEAAIKQTQIDDLTRVARQIPRLKVLEEAIAKHIGYRDWHAREKGYWTNNKGIKKKHSDWKVDQDNYIAKLRSEHSQITAEARGFGLL